MHKPIFVKALSGYRLQLRFSDGLEGTVSLADELYGPIFEPLKNPEVFNQVVVDEFGAVSWPNGADLDPYALYEDVRRQSKAA